MIIHSSKELAAFARGYRHRKKLSQTELGEQVGLPQKTVSAFERRPDSTKLETFFRLLSALDLELQLVSKKEPNSATIGWDEEW
jgi:HTH-type transcriptional regulator / antitoxin HipB